MTQALIALGGGILLGLRWKCFILLPTILVVVVMMICIDGLSWTNAGHVLLAIVAIEVGYLCGIATRPITGAFRYAKKWRATPDRG